jgi:predicted ATPase with chaperone activity
MIDIHVEVPVVLYSDLASKQDAETSSDIRKRVNATRKAQNARFKSLKIYFNAHMYPKHLKKFCGLDAESRGLLKNAIVYINHVHMYIIYVLNQRRCGLAKTEALTQFPFFVYAKSGII